MNNRHIIVTIFYLLFLTSTCLLTGCGSDDEETLTGCGNGIVDAELGEVCDDGINNGQEGSLCSLSCLTLSETVICGDGSIYDANSDGVHDSTAGDEECDDANALSEDGCSSECHVEFCGDSVIQTGMGEACDDGNLLSNDGCSSLCQVDTVATETECSDGLDNDEDTAVDCADADCFTSPKCDVDADGILDTEDTDSDNDGLTDDVDPDLDGDGLCDNAALCTVIDTELRKINLWWYVRPRISTEVATQVFGKAYTFIAATMPGQLHENQVVDGVIDADSLDPVPSIYQDCFDQNVPVQAKTGICIEHSHIAEQ